MIKLTTATPKGKLGFVFPGQASQFVGMGKSLYEQSSAARAIFEQVDDTLGRSLTQLMFHGPIEELTNTENTQPAVLAVSLATHAALLEIAGQKLQPRAVAGHSLGEYSALAVAKVLSVSDTIHLVVERARLMQEACDEKPGGMVALIGIDEFAVEDVCRETGAQIANLNTPNQTIISGTHRSIAQAIDLAAARGARKCITLQVGGAFHSGLMEPAQVDLNKIIESLEFNDPVIPIIGNIEATTLDTGKAVKNELKRQLTSCVQWSKTIDVMIVYGIGRFIELGPGNVLTGMIRKIDDTLDVTSAGDMKSIKAFAA